MPIRGAPDVDDPTLFAGVGGAGTFPAGDHIPHEPETTTTAATQELVVFVGATMAVHLSTIRSAYMENFGMVERRRCSILTASDAGGEKGVNRFPSDGGGGDGGDGDIDRGIEEGWLNALQAIVEENEARWRYRSPRGVPIYSLYRPY